MEKNIIRFLILLSAASLLFMGIVVPPVYADSGSTHAVESQNTYTVQPGDTMLKIAARFEIPVNQLAAANDTRWNAWVYVGQELVAPSTATEASSAPRVEDLGPDPRVPDPLPALPLLPLARPSEVVPFTYARVIEDNAAVYASPEEAARGLPAKRTLGVGYVWVSVEDKVTYEGQDYYRINAAEYVRAEALSFYSPSRFQGVALAEQPERPFAWILKAVQPLITPSGEVNPNASAYQRYDLVQIFATEHVGVQVWYLIGPHQWINQIYVGKVTPSAPPPDVGATESWIEVNLFEQTLAAYEGERMVYATLVSSGLRGWDTPPGLFRAWLNVASRKMSGGYGRPDYYFLEDVPWTIYFNRDIALHTAYWHDCFGYRHSHGCVNLPPLDARWLYDWAPDDVLVWVRSGVVS